MAAGAWSRPLWNSTPPADPVSDSDDGGGGGGDAADRRSALEDSIFAAYLQISGRSTPDLSKIRSFLSSSAGRGPYVACLICLERIRPTDPAWSCASVCYALSDLVCIQSWAQQSSQRLPPAASGAAAFPSASDWHCPKCRLDYPRPRIPRSYICFCGKVEDPPAAPWLLPHYCGEVCDRPLPGDCDHRCLLLCHPGPCPPCPKLVKSRCFCGSKEDMRRCAQKLYSCNQRCSKLLPCRTHMCVEPCHEGPCPPCWVKGVYPCACGNTEEEKECCKMGFQCDRQCNGLLTCGKHKCDRGCHSGPCGDCSLKGGGHALAGIRSTRGFLVILICLRVAHHVIKS